MKRFCLLSFLLILNACGFLENLPNTNITATISFLVTGKVDFATTDSNPSAQSLASLKPKFQSVDNTTYTVEVIDLESGKSLASGTSDSNGNYRVFVPLAAFKAGQSLFVTAYRKGVRGYALFRAESVKAETTLTQDVTSGSTTSTLLTEDAIKEEIATSYTLGNPIPKTLKMDPVRLKEVYDRLLTSAEKTGLANRVKTMRIFFEVGVDLGLVENPQLLTHYLMQSSETNTMKDKFELLMPTVAARNGVTPSEFQNNVLQIFPTTVRQSTTFIKSTIADPKSTFYQSAAQATTSVREELASRIATLLSVTDNPSVYISDRTISFINDLGTNPTAFLSTLQDRSRAQVVHDLITAFNAHKELKAPISIVVIYVVQVVPTIAGAEGTTARQNLVNDVTNLFKTYEDSLGKDNKASSDASSYQNLTQAAPQTIQVLYTNKNETRTTENFNYLNLIQTAATVPGLRLNACSGVSCCVDIAWDSVTGVTGYNIYAGTAADFTPSAASRLNTSPGSATSPLKHRAGSANCRTYYYKATTMQSSSEGSPSPSYSLTATHSFEKTEIPSSGGRATYPSMVLDSDGYVHMSSVNNWGGSLMYATNRSGTWQQITVDTNVGYVGETSITRDSSNGLHITYFDNSYNRDLRTDLSPDTLKYAFCAGGSDCTQPNNWHTTVVRTLYASYAGYKGLSDIGVDSSGTLHVIYTDTDNTVQPVRLWKTQCSGNCTSSSSWSVRDQIDANLGSSGPYPRISLASDRQNKMHVAYVANSGSTMTLRYATNASGNWSSVTLETNQATTFPSLVLDSEQKVHVTYNSYSGIGWQLKYTTNQSGSWNSTSLNTPGEGGYFSSLAIDNADKLHIAYFDSDYVRTLKYATNATGSWVFYTVDSNSNYSGSNSNWYANIALDASGTPHFGYFYYYGYLLKYAKLNPG